MRSDCSTHSHDLSIFLLCTRRRLERDGIWQVYSVLSVPLSLLMTEVPVDAPSRAKVRGAHAIQRMSSHVSGDMNIH